MLARLQQLGVEGQRLRIVTSLAGAPGLKAIGELHQDLTIYTACIDAEVNGEGQLLPGCGAVAERLLGTSPRLGR